MSLSSPMATISDGQSDLWGCSIRWIAAEARDFQDPWWILFSSAAVISGAKLEPCEDIDLLMSVSDAKRLLSKFPQDEIGNAMPDGRYRSGVFGRIFPEQFPIEIMADFELNAAGQWRAVWPTTRLSKAGVFVPSIPEQIDFYRSMARPKDEIKIEALRAIA